MQKLILLVVAAAWFAVLVPPLLRSRFERRPGSSVTDFRRQLSTLQRSGVGPRGVQPVRMMARPLVPAGTRPVLRTPVRVDRGRAQVAPSANQRRRNVVAALSLATLCTLAGAIVTASDAMVYGFVFSAIALSAYCYQLVQRRRTAPVRVVGSGYRRVA
jgi:hypothetical protein